MNYAMLLIAFSVGGMVGAGVVAMMAMSGRQSDQEWFEIEKQEAFERGKQEGIYQETMRRQYLFGDGVSHEQA